MDTSLPAAVRSIPDLWRGHQVMHDVAALPTGQPALDRRLPGHGWPMGALTELLPQVPGSGEFSLLFPALARLTAQARWVVLVDPPWVPYPPALHGNGVDLAHLLLVRTSSAAESLWACEQALHGLQGGAVLAWPDQPSFTRLRRLQLAARSTHAAVFLFRPPEAAAIASPAELRLRLVASGDGSHVTVLKCRGARPAGQIPIRRTPPAPTMLHRADAATPPTHRPPRTDDTAPGRRAAGPVH
ncbi:MAG: translesion DNA synthesis-associated protein ImuA [Xanthomonadales bacterium]|nr:translesion DNA synthesis-associated protein ImuA [Xanthomonadales bacterium]NIN58652.1 translesion DNA synthesis-associated protein ImuA [Xanthomonadales bacterium]NIN73947.1 translesion DNA synthesis-associated protein ImuA [Xanthomonadales bacterium]NIO14579.1 translesion DNA synthesis-associated protein ImuA [Xanthomonadales bacterium]NIP11045.1 translesion DNA synthesis-associated protein ImuA [Xanthomonadales bacterium]